MSTVYRAIDSETARVTRLYREGSLSETEYHRRVALANAHKETPVTATATRKLSDSARIARLERTVRELKRITPITSTLTLVDTQGVHAGKIANNARQSAKDTTGNRATTTPRDRQAEAWVLRMLATPSTRPAAFIAGAREIAPGASALEVRQAWNDRRVELSDCATGYALHAGRMFGLMWADCNYAYSVSNHGVA